MIIYISAADHKPAIILLVTVKMYGVYSQLQIGLILIATLCCATVDISIHSRKEDQFKLFIVVSETYIYNDVTNEECKLLNASECNTLAYFMNCSSDYFKSNEIYQFQAGTHTPLGNSTVIVTSVSNLILRGPNLTNESALINCSGASVAFVFENSTNIVIKDLTFDYCTPAEHFGSDRVHYRGYPVLGFINNTDIHLSRLSLSNSVDEAFYIQDTLGELCLSELQVTNSNTAGREIESAGNAIVYRTCSDQVSPLLLEDSIFSNNSNLAQTDLSKCPTPVFSKGVPRGGGLSIRIECDNVNVSIRNLIMVGNAGGDGGNLELVFDGGKSFAPIEIVSSHFESGYGLEGGGMRIVIFPNTTFTTDVTTNVSSNVQRSTQSRVFLRVRNTIFMENEAVYAGAGVYIKQAQVLGTQSELGIAFLNSTFINNAVCIRGFGGIAFHSISYLSTGYYHHESPQFQIILKNCNFSGNFAHDSDQRSGSGTGVIFTKLNEYFKLNNCIIHDNNSTGVLAISSNIIASGDVTITDNRKGASGGGILLCQNAVIYFSARVTVTITNNRAEHAGGGICVETECLQSKPPCFFQLGFEALVNHSLIDTIHVNVFDNFARNFAGDNLFGGSIDYCYMIDDPKHKANHSREMFRKLFNITNNTANPLSITSSPLTVCLCHKGEMLCGQKLPRNLTHRHIFRGETFKVDVVLVGQQNGLVPGTVHAWLKGIKLDKFNNFYRGQKLQKVGTKEHCNTLRYAITATSNHREVILQLGAEPSGDVSGFELLQQYKRLEIKVVFKECPVGFILVNGSCVCNRLLSLRNIRCNIRDQTISGVFPGWIGMVNHTLVYQRHCPYDYCSQSNIKIHANEMAVSEDEQCAKHRTGIMCGRCAPGLSIVFGTHKCEQCSNYWLMMLPVYAVVGVIIVFMLTVLDITISEGTFGGLIFYCNVVNSNYSTYFQEANVPFLTNALKLFISLFNLETGQTVCLFDGMDEYTRNWLSFGFPMYLWFLTGVMICLSKRYSWIARRNAVKVLATLILLSYAQNLLAAIDALHVAILYGEDGKHEWHWLRDGSLKYFKGKHVPLALFASLFSLLLLPFAFALFFNQCLQRVTHHCLFSWVTRLKPLFDAYTGPFNANARFWTGLLLIVRIMILITSAYNSGGDPGKTLDTILVSVVLLLATSHTLSAGLYRRHCLNILESWFLVNLALLSASAKSHYSITFSIISSHLLIGLAFLTALGIIAYHVSKVKAIRKIVLLLFKCHCRCKRKRESHHMQQSLDWNSEDEDRYHIENFPRYIATDEEREPLLATT